jgi:AraC-like DNA-binding protein
MVRDVDLPTLLRELALRAGGVVLLDPCDIDGGAFETLLGRCAAAAARLVLFPSDPEALGETLLSADRHVHVECSILERQHHDRVVRALLASTTPSTPARVLHLIGDRLIRLPPRIASICVRMFSFLPLPQSADALYSLAGCHQSTLCSYHRAAGIVNPLALLRIARLARAHYLATRTGCAWQDIAVSAGFRDGDSLSRAFRSVIQLRSAQAALVHLSGVPEALAAKARRSSPLGKANHPCFGRVIVESDRRGPYSTPAARV